MFNFTTCKNPKDLNQILELQTRNFEAALSTEECKDQGFVTVRHDYELLEFMNRPFPHIIARHGNDLAGYALVMLESLQNRIPVLFSMFEKINALEYNGEILGESDYFVVGQICVDKKFRGQGVVAGMYKEMKKQMAPHFKYMVTEIATRNQRSVKAHQKVGFREVLNFSDDRENWSLILMELR